MVVVMMGERSNEVVMWCWCDVDHSFNRGTITVHNNLQDMWVMVVFG